jgi:transcriptional regulator with XRE-family HTH domain
LTLDQKEFLFLNVFPIHRQPKDFESLTGLLRRLALDNHFSSIDALMALCFPQQSRRVARNQADFPPGFIEKLAKLAYCDTANLLTLTFYHLGRKFGRATHSQPMSRFLGGSIAPFLRYCPTCVATEGYYKLPWRFNFLEGCLKHRCYLVDRCPQCKKAIPLWTNSFALDRCPKCQGTLLCDALELNQEEHQAVECQDLDLTFLLTPQPWEEQAADIIVLLGAQFARLRRLKRQTAEEIARQLGITINAVEGIERGNVRGRGATFSDYLKFARYLDVTLLELFTWAVSRCRETTEAKSEGFAFPRPLDIRQEFEGVILQRVEQAARHLEVQGNPVTQQAVGNIVGMTPQGLKKYPKVKSFLTERAAMNRVNRRLASEEREDDLLQKIPIVAEELRLGHKHVSQRAIAGALGIPWSSLRSYPRVRELLRIFGDSYQHI